MPRTDRSQLEGRITLPAEPAPVPSPPAPEEQKPGDMPAAPMRALTDAVACARDYAMAAGSLLGASRNLQPAHKANVRRLLRLALEHLSD